MSAYTPPVSTPSTTVSTGRSFGWISLKNPSLPMGSFKVPISASFSRGTIPVTSTTRSAWMVSSSPPVKESRVVTQSRPSLPRVTAGGVSSGYFM